MSILDFKAPEVPRPRHASEDCSHAFTPQQETSAGADPVARVSSLRSISLPIFERLGDDRNVEEWLSPPETLIIELRQQDHGEPRDLIS